MTVAAAHASAIAAAIDVAPLVLFAGAVGTAGLLGGPGNESELYEPGTLGGFLRKAQNEIDLLVRDAMRDQREAVVAAGLQAERAVSRARVAYRESLGRKDADLGPSERKFETEVGRILADLAAGANESIDAAGERARQLGNALRFPDGAPEVFSFGPQYVFAFLPFQTITIRGRFPAAYEKTEVPRLTVNGKSYPAYSYGTESIEFSVPAGSLPPSGGPDTIAWHKAELAIPWTRPLFDPLQRSGYSNFVVLGVLPDSPGRATVEHRTDVAGTEEQTRTSGAFELEPPLEGSRETRCLELSAEDVAAGWKLVPGSARIAFGPLAGSAGGAGAENLGLASETSRSACWSVRAAQADGSDTADRGQRMQSGSWKITAGVRREVLRSSIARESFDLSWGARRTFPYPPGTWKMRYALFNRAPAETDKARSSAFIRIAADSQGVTIRTFPF